MSYDFFFNAEGVCRSHWYQSITRADEASLCVKLLGRSFLIGRSGRLPLPEVVAAFVLLSHAVHQEEDEEDGKEEADNSTRDDSCNRGFREAVISSKTSAGFSQHTSNIIRRATWRECHLGVYGSYGADPDYIRN